MDTRKTGVELGLELAAKSVEIKYHENPTFLGKLDFYLVKEYHQLCWWFQKALAMPRINYPSVARNNY